MDRQTHLRYRIAPLEMGPSEFRKAGYRVVDAIAEFLCSLPERPVTPHESPEIVREALHTGSLPEEGMEARQLLEDTAQLLFEHSLFNGHPRFMGMITSSAAPIGALGDLLAAAVNPNVGSWSLAPVATEIEAQTIRWIAEMIGYPTDCGGIMVSGGNMGNFVGFLTARKAKATWDIRRKGLAGGESSKLCLYASQETHTWIHKAADLFGSGLDAIRWIPVDGQQRMDTQALRTHIKQDSAEGNKPFLVVGTAGTVSTGAVDPLAEIAAICREHHLWFHVDGAYGGIAALLLENNEGIEVPPDLQGIREADSVAIDPHKWLYAPLEAGCVLVKDATFLRDAFSSHHPAYYRFDDEETINYYEYGFQNSRGFRALKVWLALRQVGREGYLRMIADDIILAQELYRLIDTQPELQACTQNLSITTFRYVPHDLNLEVVGAENYLNRLNEEILTRIQKSGAAFISNAVIHDTFLLRACIVNFRTSLEDIEALTDLVIRIGKQVDMQLRPAELPRG